MIQGVNVRLAMSNDFLLAYSKLSRKRQKKVREFIEKFSTTPTQSGLNYETIQNAANPNYRSVRVDQAYRAIVLKPEKGNVYLLMWVDHHDDAYAWATRHQASIHPSTGAIQVYRVEEDESAPEAPSSVSPTVPQEEDPLLKGIRDRELLSLGIPEDRIHLVKGICSDRELEAIQSKLPQEAFEAVYLLAAGYTVEQTYRELELSAERKPVDTTDYLAALMHPDSQRRFAFVSDDEELQKILNAPLEQWRIFLHPSQRKLVTMQANGPVRVLGGAGTGKTVVAMHRAQWLAEHVLTSDSEKVLFTTFTRNLANDIQENLRQLCSPETLRTIEVSNIDAWVHHFLKKNGYDFRIVFGSELEELWEYALNLAPEAPDLSPEFYRQEWDQVIQARGVDALEAYIRADRTGRGRALNRRQRVALWPVFEEYRALLNERRWRELTDATRDARMLLERKGNILPYRSIVLDEAQDMNAEVFRLLRQMIPHEVAGQGNDLFIVGDAHQRIYGNRVVLGHCGVDIRGRGKRLRVNYRTTEETRKWALALLENRRFDDLDGGVDTQKGGRSLLQGPAPVVRRFDFFESEVNAVHEELKLLKRAGAEAESVCLAARTNALIEQYRTALESCGWCTYTIKRTTSDQRDQPGIRLATMHRVKGLEFDHVLVLGANKGIIPYERALRYDNPHDQEQSEVQERSLFHVAATRARKTLWISGYGDLSPFLIS